MSDSSTFPVALDRDIGHGSLIRARLNGEAIVLWRGDDDVVRVWEDRCPHRSLRLSAGRNLGAYLEGSYHGWQFGKDGSVIAVPAQNYEPQPDITARVIASAVQAGIVWASLGNAAAAPANWPGEGYTILLRPLPFEVAAADVEGALKTVEGVTLIVTPTSPTSSFVFGYARAVAGESEIETLRRVDARLSSVRRLLEARRAA